MKILFFGLSSIGIVAGLAYSDDGLTLGADGGPAEVIEFMLGEWSGDCWMPAPNGDHAEFRVEESVVAGANDHAVFTHGTAYAGNDDRIVHDVPAWSGRKVMAAIACARS